MIPFGTVGHYTAAAITVEVDGTEDITTNDSTFSIGVTVVLTLLSNLSKYKAGLKNWNQI